MSAAAFLRRFGRDRRGAGAAEFALVLPLSILFLVGLLDTGRLFYDINRGEFYVDRKDKVDGRSDFSWFAIGF